MHKIYAINQNWAMNVIWRVLKPFLHKKTISNVQFLSKDYPTFFREQMDVAVLPVPYGGENPILLD